MKLGLIDRVAAPGLPAETGGTLQRIDDLGKHVFDAAVRGRTDRFVFRFRRP